MWLAHHTAVSFEYKKIRLMQPLGKELHEKLIAPSSQELAAVHVQKRQHTAKRNKIVVRKLQSIRQSKVCML